jgi:cytochrome oxidase Cu insertion factor (SCO1/SenC/PrrC family)
MRPRARDVIAAFAVVSVATAAAAQARADRSAPPDEDRFVNTTLPNVTIRTARGAATIADAAGGRPFLLALVFTRCAGVCSPFLASWRSADRSIGQPPDVHRVVLSFDPRDTVADMNEFGRHFGLDADPHWTFGVADPDAIARLADAAGFWYDWDPARQQFDHPAMLAAVRNGRLIRLLVGGSISSGRLDELVRESTGRFVASYPLPGRARFRCVQYDPRTGDTSLDWGFALLLVPVGAISMTTAVLFAAGARVRRTVREGAAR